MAWDEIEQEIVDALKAIDECWDDEWNGRACTRKVKKAIRRIGKKRGFVACATRRRWHKHREWLYDLCWRKEDAKGRLLEMPLVMESEWDDRKSELVRDFQKLLVARAKYRIFLFYKETAEEGASFVKRLIKQVRLYHGTQVGDRYLFGCWPDDDDWQFQQYVHGAGDAA